MIRSQFHAGYSAPRATMHVLIPSVQTHRKRSSNSHEAEFPNLSKLAFYLWRECDVGRRLQRAC